MCTAGEGYNNSAGPAKKWSSLLSQREDWSCIRTPRIEVRACELSAGSDAAETPKSRPHSEAMRDTPIRSRQRGFVSSGKFGLIGKGRISQPPGYFACGFGKSSRPTGED